MYHVSWPLYIYTKVYVNKYTSWILFFFSLLSVDWLSSLWEELLYWAWGTQQSHWDRSGETEKETQSEGQWQHIQVHTWSFSFFQPTLTHIQNEQVSGAAPPKPTTSFAHFGFDEQLMNQICKSEYTRPTPIQCQVSCQTLPQMYLQFFRY